MTRKKSCSMLMIMSILLPTVQKEKKQKNTPSGSMFVNFFLPLWTGNPKSLTISFLMCFSLTEKKKNKLHAIPFSVDSLNEMFHCAYPTIVGWAHNVCWFLIFVCVHSWSSFFLLCSSTLSHSEQLTVVQTVFFLLLFFIIVLYGAWNFR